MAEGVKSAMRAFEILELFDVHQRPLSLKDIISELGYPASSGSALLKSFVEMGYLDYDRVRRTYMPTMRVSLLGRWTEEASFGSSRFTEVMQQLHQQTGEAIILAVQSDLYAQYTHIIYSERPLQYRAKPGFRRPLLSSGTGWAILAAKPDAEIEILRQRIEAQSGDVVSRTALKRQIDEVREKGYAFSKHVISEGVGVIAMTLPNAPFGRVFALAAAGYVSGLERAEVDIVAHLRAAIRDLTASFS